MRYLDELEIWQTQLRNTKLQLLSEEDISANVIKALTLDRERRKRIIQQYVPRILHRSFDHLWGITGGGLSNGSDEIGERIYRVYVFRKKG